MATNKHLAIVDQISLNREGLNAPHSGSQWRWPNWRRDVERVYAQALKMIER
jgi:hypothetical protein